MSAPAGTAPAGTEPVGVPDRRAPTGRLGRGLLPLLGPAFVAAIAYVDPGNVAANVSAGSRYGYMLLWVLVAANLMAVLVQYQSARLGIVTGKSLPDLLGERLRRPARLAYWGQAEVVAAATDVAEVIGGAIALQLLFDLPLVLGGVIVGVVSLGLLLVQGRGQRRFEAAVIALLAVITVGFVAGLFVAPPAPGDVLGGLVPRFDGADSVLLAASMLGATVMPHAVYLHSALARDHHARGQHAPDQHGRGVDATADHRRVRRLLGATRWDVVGALAVAGVVNVALLLVAATTLRGVDGTDTIEGAHQAIVDALGPGIGVVFALGLLASGLASTSVGAYAGAVIMGGLLKVRVPLAVRRVVTLIPALVILAAGAEPTWALVVSQVVLSFGIAFALVPLLRLTGNSEVMGEFVDGPRMRVAGWTVAAAIVTLNLALLVLTVAG
ncbi:manganese transport protein [Luteimicrobium subarcticum]|uniref:Manganese transport protein n=1 Tax=Luteimicrobium subarcticum TaxID=620910 RepID=A0A2M8WWG4_9MICO|nr:manganese transport protein [Luteimicrobium subarcticum]